MSSLPLRPLKNSTKLRHSREGGNLMVVNLAKKGIPAGVYPREDGDLKLGMTV